MNADHALLVSAICADHHASANALANSNEAAAVADCNIEANCRFEEAALANDDDDSIRRGHIRKRLANDDDDSAADVVSGSVSSTASISAVMTNLSSLLDDSDSDVDMVADDARSDGGELRDFL